MFEGCYVGVRTKEIKKAVASLCCAAIFLEVESLSIDSAASEVVMFNSLFKKIQRKNATLRTNW